MNRTFGVALSVASGLFGGFLSHYFFASATEAQAWPGEIRAHSFVLLDHSNRPVGLFGFDPNGNADVVLLDKTGKIVWSASGQPSGKPLNVNAEK